MEFKDADAEIIANILKNEVGPAISLTGNMNGFLIEERVTDDYYLLDIKRGGYTRHRNPGMICRVYGSRYDVTKILITSTSMISIEGIVLERT